MMTTPLKDKIGKLGPERRRKIEARAAELIAEEMSLSDLRRAHELTQQRMAEFLGVGQEGVSRLEKRSDLLISTLRSYVEAMGGRLRLVAEFPGRPPVVLSGIAEMEASEKARPTTGKKSRAKPE
jgi:DNA-binding XRE family transcriptional regulator